MICRRWLWIALLAVAACGGADEAAEPMDDDGDTPPDAATPADAGTDAARADAGPDAARDAAVDAGDGRVVKAAGSCDASVGEMAIPACYTTAELSGMGCTLANVLASDMSSKVSATRTDLERARFAIIWGLRGRIETHVCSGPPPSTNYVCQEVAAQTCSNIGDPASCSLYTGTTRIPTVYAICGSQ
jgi:hypothetical protein